MLIYPFNTDLHLLFSDRKDYRITIVIVDDFVTSILSYFGKCVGQLTRVFSIQILYLYCYFWNSLLSIFIFLNIPVSRRIY